MKTTFLSLLLLFSSVGALVTPRRRSIGDVVGSIYNDGIRLAVTPKCGPLAGPMADVNAGLDLSKVKTIVSFGVSICVIAIVFDTDAQHWFRIRTPMEAETMTDLPLHRQSLYRPIQRQVDALRMGSFGLRTSLMILEQRSWITP
jgi:hypothetical protein